MENRGKNKEYQYRLDSSYWDMDLYRIDYEKKNSGKTDKGFFPTSKYSLSEIDFNGLGYGGHFTGVEINNKQFVYNFFYFNKNQLNEDYLTDSQKNEVFFAIALLTDFIDEENYSHIKPNITSRNHPDYLAEGSLRTNNSLVKYAAFVTAQNDSYAVLNSRIFNLKYGRLLIIIPYKDGSLRPIQIEIPSSSNKEIDSIILKMLDKPIVKEIYLNSEAIDTP